jgi:hypothetical protein
MTRGLALQILMIVAISGPLDKAALNAYRQWRFKPGTVRKNEDPDHVYDTGVSY